MRAAFVVLGLAAVGCNSATSDPCKGVAGTCVSLTVQSSTVATVDTLHILASGALMGDQTSAGGRTDLPVAVALKLPANVAGSLDLHVDAFLTSQLVGACDTDTLVTPGQHATAVCTLVGVDNGMPDLSMGGGAGDGGSGDMVALPCDPKGMTGPQCVWRWQTPLPQGDDLKAVVAFTDSDTLALTVDGTVLHRDAGGAWTTLTARPTAMNQQTTDTMFSAGGNSMDVWIGGTGYTTTTIPLVWHSPDRGLTWTQETLPGAATGTVGKGATTGSAAILPASAANGNVYVRSTAGTWSTVSTNSASASYYAAAMTFGYGVVVGGVSGTSPAIAYTVNDGAAWTFVPAANVTPASAQSQPLYGVCLGPGATNSWWAVGGAVIVHATGNMPSSWAQQGSAVTTGASLIGCVATDSMHAWAYGGNGTVFVTSDGGTTWAGVATPPATTNAFQSGAHSSGAALTLVGDKGIIFRSSNGGSSFTAEQSGPQDRLTAAFGPAPNTVFATGDNGVIYTTTDDGAHWTKLAVPSATGTTAYLYGVWGYSATDVYVVGVNGTLLHSSNGTTFTNYTGAGAPPTTTAFDDVWGSTANGVYAVGTDG